MILKSQKRIAAQVLKVGINKVWLDPERIDDIKEAITKADIRSLIKSGVIKAHKLKTNSRARFRKRLEQKRPEGLFCFNAYSIVVPCGLSSIRIFVSL